MSRFDIKIPTINPVMGSVKQVAYIVDDIDQAIADWKEKYDVGPWVVARDEKPMINAFYRGERSETLVVDLAFAYHGELQIELIVLKKSVPSMCTEVIERGQKDLQHYGVCVADFPKAVEYYKANGFIPVVEAGIEGLAQMHYVEATDFEKMCFQKVKPPT